MTAARLTALALGAFALALVCIHFTREYGRVAAIWPGNALILAVLLRLSPRSWAAYTAAGLAGYLAANLALGDTPGSALMLAACNGLEVLIAVLLCRGTIGPRLDVTRPRELATLAAAAATAPLASAFVAQAILPDTTGAVFVRWYLSDALGLFLVTPALLTLAGDFNSLKRVVRTPASLGPLVALMAAFIVVFGQTTFSLLFLIFPPLIWAAFVLGGAGTAAVLLVTTCVVVVATLSGHGATAHLDTGLQIKLVILQVLLAAITLVTLPLTAVLAERRRLDTSLREALAQVGDSEARYRTLADNVTDVIACFDTQARFTFLSPSIETLLGYKPEELIGRSTREIMHPDDYRRSLAEYAGQVDSGQEDFRFEYRAFRKDGSLAWLSGHPRAMRNAETGELTGFLDVVRDVSVRKELEAELLTARDDAQAAAATKAEFMANMSHEIRTPLTAVLGFTSLLAGREDLATDARRQVGRIGAAGEAMLAIVNDILDFSKLEAGLMPVAPRPARPKELLENALALFEPQAAAKGLRLTFEATDLPENVSLDPDRVRQVLLNLIGNAVKFTLVGSVAVTAAYEDGRLKVSVRDSGAGMDEAQQAKLFQRFSQVDGAAARTGGGTGLGLAISLGLVQAMGGQIGLTSARGEGSTFAFDIPAPTCDGEAVVEAVAPRGVEGLRVLVADDNPTNRELALALMTPFGIEVTTAVDGAEAVELASVLPYDVILLDVRMPVLDGPGAVRRIRSEAGPNQTTPVLAFSAQHELDAAIAGLFDGHLHKPIALAPLLDALARATAWEEALYAAEA